MRREFVHKVVAIDANFLIAMIAPRDISADNLERVVHLIGVIEKAKAKILIPMPAVAEFLVGADTAGIQTLNSLDRKSFIQVASFDRPAAFECANIDRAALGAGDKRDGSVEPWQKIKVDRQIVGIAKANGATLLVSSDSGLRATALRVGIQAMDFGDLELPESSKQVPMNFDAEQDEE